MSAIDDIQARLDDIAIRIEAAKKQLKTVSGATDLDFVTAESFEARYRQILARLDGEAERDGADRKTPPQQDIPVPLLEQQTFEHDLTQWLLDLDRRFNAPPERVQNASV